MCNGDANGNGDTDAGATVIALHILRIVELKKVLNWIIMIKIPICDVIYEQELPEDNEARRVEGVWSKGQGHRGQNVDMHGKDLYQAFVWYISMVWLSGYMSNDQFSKPKRKF